jgi:hypothetical protein
MMIEPEARARRATAYLPAATHEDLSAGRARQSDRASPEPLSTTITRRRSDASNHASASRTHPATVTLVEAGRITDTDPAPFGRAMPSSGCGPRATVGAVPGSAVQRR